MNTRMLRDLTKQIEIHNAKRAKCFELIQSPTTINPNRPIEPRIQSFFSLFGHKKSKYSLDRKSIRASIRAVTAMHPKQD